MERRGEDQICTEMEMNGPETASNEKERRGKVGIEKEKKGILLIDMEKK